VGRRRRRALLAELGKVGGEGSVNVLRANLRSPDLRTRVSALFALVEIGNEKAVDVLIECLRMELGPPFTFAVAELGKLRARRAIPALIETLDRRAEELDEGNKRVIIRALAHMPHRSQVPVLSTALRRGGLRTRRVAAMALVQIRAPESQAALEDAVKSLSWLRARQARRALRARICYPSG
jgi:HEAT repeat protein